jgi:hypothetical protein
MSRIAKNAYGEDSKLSQGAHFAEIALRDSLP